MGCHYDEYYEFLRDSEPRESLKEYSARMDQERIERLKADPPKQATPVPLVDKGPQEKEHHILFKNIKITEADLKRIKKAFKTQNEKHIS